MSNGSLPSPDLSPDNVIQVEGWLYCLTVLKEYRQSNSVLYKLPYCTAEPGGSLRFKLQNDGVRPNSSISYLVSP